MREHRETIYVCTFVRHLLSGDISCILEQWGSTFARLRTKSAARYVGRLVRKKKEKKRKEEERNCQLRSQRNSLLLFEMRDFTFWKVRMFYSKIVYDGNIVISDERYFLTSLIYFLNLV